MQRASQILQLEHTILNEVASLVASGPPWRYRQQISG